MTDAPRLPTAEPVGSADKWLPRSLSVGSLTLDLLLRDGRVNSRRVGLHPKEFEVLWRLAQAPDQIVTRAQLLQDIWGIDYDPGSNRVEVNVSRIRSKLHVFKLASLVITGPHGGYRLDCGESGQHSLLG